MIPCSIPPAKRKKEGETQKEIKDTEMEDLKVRYSMKMKIF